MDELKDKYGIEMIGKEMWVWDNGPEDAFLCLVIYKDPEANFPYITIDKHGHSEFFINASETNPNEPQEPKVGDIGYFWDDQKAYSYGELIYFYDKQPHKYLTCTNSYFINFSKDKQPWMK
jgi:hypothetical protein